MRQAGAWVKRGAARTVLDLVVFLPLRTYISFALFYLGYFRPAIADVNVGVDADQGSTQEFLSPLCSLLQVQVSDTEPITSGHGRIQLHTYTERERVFARAYQNSSSRPSASH